MLANAPDARLATNVVISGSCIPFDYWATGEMIVHCKRVSDGSPNTFINLPDDSPLFSIPPHIKCFRQNVKSRAHLLKLSYREFKAGAHLCYNDAIFTAVGSAIEMSARLDRELRV